MLTFAKLQKKSRQFHSFTGLTPAQFEQVLEALRPVYEQAEQERLRRPDRHRAIGAGRRFSLALPERLLMGLMYWRLYVTQDLLSYLFGLDAGNISREINQRLRPRLLAVLPIPMRDTFLLGAAGKDAAGKDAAGKDAAGKDAAGKDAAGKPKRRIGTIAELLSAHPEFGEVFPELREVFVDATEQPVPKPKTKTKEGAPKPEGKAARKMRYSGKHKKHTIKTQVVTTTTCVLHVLGGLPGSVHDYTLLRASGALRHIPPDMTVRVDRGYEGVETEYPQVQIEKPVRGQRGRRGFGLVWMHHYVAVGLEVPCEAFGQCLNAGNPFHRRYAIPSRHD